MTFQDTMDNTVNDKLKVFKNDELKKIIIDNKEYLNRTVINLDVDVKLENDPTIDDHYEGVVHFLHFNYKLVIFNKVVSENTNMEFSYYKDSKPEDLNQYYDSDGKSIFFDNYKLLGSKKDNKRILFLKKFLLLSYLKEQKLNNRLNRNDLEIDEIEKQLKKILFIMLTFTPLQ